MKQVYQKHWVENMQQKQDQNKYFREEITKKEQNLPTIKEIKHNDY